MLRESDHSREGARKGGTAMHVNARREQAARELIAPALTFRDHTSCDPEEPDTLCGECQECMEE